MPAAHFHRSLPLWPLPLALAVLPLLAANLAWVISLRAELVPACVPHLEGCISISRAARHGLGNDLFRMVMLPCAALQALLWLAMEHWLHNQGRHPLHLVAWLGLVAAAFLALYVTFLGTEGDVYRVLRRHGVIIYFAATYLALLISLHALAHKPRDPAYRPLLVVAVGMLALGLANVVVSLAVADGELRSRIENVLEWQLGLWLTAMFALMAWRWRRLRVRLC